MDLSKRMNALSFAFAALVALGCGNGAGNGATTGSTTEAQGESGDDESAGDAAGRMERGFFVTDDAPAPQACESDEDCVASGALSDDGCCWSYRDMNATPISAAYRDWQQRHRDAHCDVGRCPPPPAPTEPPDCLFDVRCDEGTCANACP